MHTHTRFEAKFIIRETRAQAIRDYVAPWVTADPHAAPGTKYPVESVYLDSPDRHTYWASATGWKNRFKLRIRYYANADAPVYCEVKRRMDGAIIKQRARAPRDAARRWLETGLGMHSLPGLTAHRRENLMAFEELARRFRAAPCVSVRYIREAYECLYTPHARLTFDRELVCRPAPPTGAALDDAGAWWPAGPPDRVILEVKFTDQMPPWLTPLLRRFDLQRSSIAKYIACVDALKPGLLMGPAAGPR